MSSFSASEALKNVFKSATTVLVIDESKFDSLKSRLVIGVVIVGALLTGNNVAAVNASSKSDIVNS